MTGTPHPTTATLATLWLLGTLLLAPGPLQSQAQAQEAPANLLFSLPEYDLYPENIAFDPVSGDYLLGSMSQSRILRIHPDGSYEEFLAAPVPELETTVGMKVDAQRRLLWVCTGRYVLYGGVTEGPARTGVLLFDLDRGVLLETWMVEQPTPSHIFNDLALTSDGDALATTTLLGKVFRIRAGSTEMELLVDGQEQQVNGITLGPEERFLFFTLDRTITRLDLTTGTMTALSVPGGAEAGTDGLYWVDGSLVALQPRRNRVVRLHLNEAMDTVDRVEVLLANDPGFHYPTTGVMVDGALVFVATSYADVPRNPDSVRQHDEVLIYRLPLSSHGESGPSEYPEASS